MQEPLSSQQNPRSKIEWTQELYLHYSKDDHVTPNDAAVLFWYNLNNTRGFRLTPRGYDVVLDAGYTLYHHKLDIKNFPINNRLLVIMDRQLMTPWYWNNKHDIVLMDERLSVLLELAGGDLAQALKNSS